MNIPQLFDDIKSPYLLYFKGGLFGLTVMMSGIFLLLFPDYFWLRLGVLVICIWSSCRFYYFFFYVLEHYAGGNKNAGIFSMIFKLCRQNQVNHWAEMETSPNTLSVTNLLTELPELLLEEQVENLVVSKNIRIERIISTGHFSPSGFWYDQTQTEWLIVLQGEAVLEFEFDVLRQLLSGDSILIPAHCKHRVVSTLPNKPTVWLTVFFNDTKNNGNRCGISD
ncbi:MAG: cupin domain-containing protein [Planctomycetaceae bacterium]|jgi:cupin 2 domain-containing protein|nr:cupin domain-containing protein [Planctomycetaceae bacterium]